MTEVLREKMGRFIALRKQNPLNNIKPFNYGTGLPRVARCFPSMQAQRGLEKLVRPFDLLVLRTAAPDDPGWPYLFAGLGIYL